jgi:hypothetical protein
MLQSYFCAGEMAERSNAAVLKTVEVKASGGSNPSLSAKGKLSRVSGIFCLERRTKFTLLSRGEQKNR